MRLLVTLVDALLVILGLSAVRMEDSTMAHNALTAILHVPLVVGHPQHVCHALQEAI